MNKVKSSLAATALVGLVAAATLVPSLATAAPGGQNHGGPRMHQGQMAFGQQMQGPGMRGAGGPGGLVSLVCAEDGAERLEHSIDHLSYRFELTEDQQVLFDAFREAALTAQTNYADTCSEPLRLGQDADSETVPNPVAGMEVRIHNMRAMADSLETVLPSLEAFFASLTDEQLADLRPEHREDGQRMGFGQGMGQGFGKGMGQHGGQGPANAAPNS